MTISLAVPDILVARARAGDLEAVGVHAGHADAATGHEGPGAVAGAPARIDLERAFERLSETSRSVVWLHDVEGYTHEEIAELMGKTVSFSKSQLARAHARLRRMLDAEGAAP